MTKPKRCTCCRCRLRRRIRRLERELRSVMQTVDAERQRMESYRDWAALTAALDAHPLALEVYGATLLRIDRSVPKHLVVASEGEKR